MRNAPAAERGIPSFGAPDMHMREVSVVLQQIGHRPAQRVLSGDDDIRLRADLQRVGMPDAG